MHGTRRAVAAQRIVGFLAFVVLSFGLEAFADTPTVLIPSGVSFFASDLPTLYDPTMIWYSIPNCTQIIGAGLPGVVAAGAPGDETSPASITRGASYGATPRLILNVNPLRPVATCNPYQLVSNIATDAESLYFVDNQGPSGHWALERRSRNANVADPSTLLVDLGTALSSAEVNAEDTGVLFVIEHTATYDVLVEYNTSGGLINGFIDFSSSLYNMQFDGKFLYWINGQNLIADDTTNGNRTAIATGVITTYRPEGYENDCSPDGCTEHVGVVFGRGNQLLLTDTVRGGLLALYTSADPNAQILSIARDAVNYFFFERRPVCDLCFDREDRLQRLSVGLNQAPALIYGPVNNGGPGFGGLISDYVYLYFTNRSNGSLLKVADNAAAIPVYAFQATGLEVTQGIQNPGSSVPLIKGRRTFVRLYVKSNGASDVNNVTAGLDVSGDNGFYLGHLDPVNRIGKLLTVRTNPKRSNLDDAFLFELPLGWTQNSTLSLLGTVNPLRAVVEDNYADDSVSLTVQGLRQSPSLPLEIIDFRYLNNGSLVTGAFPEDYNSMDYMTRLYPLAVTNTTLGDPRPGLHSTISYVWDDAMLAHVNKTSADCAPLLVLNPDKTVKSDNRNMCAGYYALAKIQSMRSAGDIPKDRYYYGAIANDGTLPNTRGFTPGSETISVGPKLDFNGTPQQNYMSHEIGHALGRGHPGNGGVAPCGETGLDTSYPYAQSKIGNSSTAANDETALMGFDPGQAFNAQQPEQLRLSSQTGDVMSYCSPYWISDYTYNALWTYMTNNTLSAAALPHAASNPAAAAAIPGDWLLAFGAFSAASQTGTFSSVRRLDTVADIPALAPGGYALELRDSGGTLLASHAFTPAVVEESGGDQLAFGLVVPFEAGTRSLRIVNTATSHVIATRSVSANPPTVSGVTVGAPDPMSGMLPVTWTANAPDGNPLQFDVFYSHDGGATWRPVRLSLTVTNLELDPSTLGGGTGVVRVEASDGAQSARGDSTPFAVAPKPPLVRIQSPANGLRVQWGQLVNFVGAADDPQGQPLPNASFVWSNKYRTLGFEQALAVTDLEVGTNDVTLTVKNAAGLSGTASVQVIVGDNLQYPGARLSLTPSTVSWTVPAIGAGIQTTSLSVLSAGSGAAFTYDAMSSQPWLQVNGAASALAAPAPGTLTLSADPSTLPAGQTSFAEVTLTNTTDATDVLKIQVMLVKGNAFLGTVPLDTDGDGIVDERDNCVLVPNPSQLDTDHDGYGNACDPDLNNDGIVNFADLAKMKSVFFKTDADADLNGDGVVNFADLAIMKKFFFKPPGPAAGKP